MSDAICKNSLAFEKLIKNYASKIAAWSCVGRRMFILGPMLARFYLPVDFRAGVMLDEARERRNKRGFLVICC